MYIKLKKIYLEGKREMVIVRIMGGLGNQMFQYAVAMALQMQGHKVKIDTSYYKNIPIGDTIRKFELACFKLNQQIEIASIKDLKKYNTITQKILEIIQQLTGCSCSGMYIECNRGYAPEIFELKDKYLIGYWQTEKYFKSIRNKLINVFQIKNEYMNQENLEFGKRIKGNNNSVFVHVRGGDYIQSNNIVNYGNICTKDYYVKAFQLMEQKIGKAKFYLFTNDLNYAYSVVPSSQYDIEYVDLNDELSGWLDLYLMSCCNHSILANSSFSWWGAWLNTNEKKIVIAPNKWENTSNNQDIFCEGWYRI